MEWEKEGGEEEGKKEGKMERRERRCHDVIVLHNAMSFLTLSALSTLAFWSLFRRTKRVLQIFSFSSNRCSANSAL